MQEGRVSVEEGEKRKENTNIEEDVLIFFLIFA